MRSETIYDIAGIGIGPFNLGLAALCNPISNLKTIFIDQKLAFDWHPGMMIPGATLQVSYLADLVTLADPSSKFSYLNYLRTTNRLLQFGIHERSYITRTEYNRYCKWVCRELDNLLFGCPVQTVSYSHQKDCFEIRINNTSSNKTEIVLARHIVIGTGSKPFIPSNLNESLSANIIHSSSYLYCKPEAVKSKKITVVGSGQSAAEVVYDLLNTVSLSSAQINWLTRSDRFYAMEHSKLNYEMTSPDYINFFYNLTPDKKEDILRRQFSLYKGINHQLIDAIYDRLYQLSAEDQKYKATIRTHSELKSIIKRPGMEHALLFYHNALKENFGLVSDFVILATGYKYTVPDFLSSIKNLIRFDQEGRYAVNRNYSIDEGNRIFVQNAEMHTHGFNTPDLGLGAYRNAVVINNISGEKIYPIDEATCFQTFGVAV